jgi:pyruvate,water dikinase
MTNLRALDQIEPTDTDAVGGKGLSLGFMARAGLPVPPGFCVVSAVHRRLRGVPLHTDPLLVEQIGAAYRTLGGGPVAVRSSATAEDGTVTSFAGQQETILGARGEEAVCAAIAKCWASLENERAAAYRRRQGVGENGLAMAVVVQRLVPAEVAGVLFTRDPLDSESRRMVIEASWGLGESVVSGRVTPDRYTVDRDTGQVMDRQLGRKTVQVTSEGVSAVPPERQAQLCLDDAHLAELAALAHKVEALYDEPRDIEWAWAEGRFWLLQARPITTAFGDEREQVRREEIADLAARAEPGGTVWSRILLAEGLPEPTPMTWAIVRRFMSGNGGYGLMYRDLGFRVDPTLADDGAFDLVAGRTFCNLSREPRFYSGWMPYVHPFDAMKADPNKALAPQPIRAMPTGAGFWLLLPLRLPFYMVGAVRFAMRLGQMSRTFASRFRQEILPPFIEETHRAAAEDWSVLDVQALQGRLDHWSHRTLTDFARDSLKPTALAGIAMANVQRWLTRKLGPERGRAAVGELTLHVRPDPEADVVAAVQDLLAGRLDQPGFLAQCGHRGRQEMELSAPRWSEDPTGLTRSAPASEPKAAAVETAPSPWERIAAEAKLSALERTALEPEVQAMLTYLSLRETAKHHLMRGYALIRRALVELDRRFHLAGGIFFLTPDELSQLVEGRDLSEVIAQRRRRRTVALSLELPAVLFSDDLEAIGRPVLVPGAEVLQGLPLSAGVAEARALVLDQPNRDASEESYILVCPSTDPAWVPLFVGARGLVMETGGVLSHGAIVAREFGLPAVAGLPGIQRRLRTGQRLRVDGARGTVQVLDSVSGS